LSAELIKNAQTVFLAILATGYFCVNYWVLGIIGYCKVVSRFSTHSRTIRVSRVY